MASLSTRGRLAAGVTLLALGTGYATAAAQAPTQPGAPRATGAAAGGIDNLTAIARKRYATEVHGGVAIGTLRRVARDPTLRRTLQSGNLSAARTYVRQTYPAVWYHWHVSRMRIVKGSQVLLDAGVPFVVAPSHMTLRASGGQPLGTLEVSIQDVIGFVRFMHRNYPVDVVVRGQGTAHVRSSLPAAAQATLPSRGTVTLAGRRYLVRSFHQSALGNEPVTVWVLAKG
jgi:hypothetical protein